MGNACFGFQALAVCQDVLRLDHKDSADELDVSLTQPCTPVKAKPTPHDLPARLELLSRLGLTVGPGLMVARRQPKHG